MFFYQCEECGNVVFSQEEKELVCCEKKMSLLLPNQVLDGEELEDIHYLNVRKIGVLYSLFFESDHPMLEVHHLDFALIETNKGFHYRKLSLEDLSSIDFLVGTDEEYVNAYVYCNQFGLIEAAKLIDLTTNNNKE